MVWIWETKLQNMKIEWLTFGAWTLLYVKNYVMIMQLGKENGEYWENTKYMLP